MFFKRIGGVFFVIIFLGFFGSITAQIPQFSATHYNAENVGLSHNTVLNMTTDRFGFVWVSTMDGLNRFDGKRVEIFRHLSNDSTSLSDSFIHGLYEHKSGDFLIGTRDGGLNILNPKTGEIERVNHETYPESNIPDAPINVIFEDSHDFLWIGFFTNSIGYLDYENKNFYSTKLIEKGTGKEVLSTNSILELKDGSFLLSSLNGIFYISVGEVEKFRSAPNSGSETIVERIFFSSENPSPNTDKIYIDSESNIWVNVVTDDLRKLSPNMLSDEIRKSVKSGLAKSSVEKVYLERGDYIIKGDIQGNLKVINKRTEEEKIIKMVDVEGVVGASTVFEDRFGNIWFYTWGAGFFRLQEKKGIKLFDGTKIASPFILGFEEGENGIWIATNEGLYFLDQEETEQISNVLNENLGSIWSIEKDKYGLWVATRTNGLQLIPEHTIQKRKPELISFKKETSLILSNNVHQVLKDSRGWLWIGYEGEGIQIVKNVDQWLDNEPVNVVSLINSGLEGSINSNSIRKLYEDDDGNIWIATTNNGLNYITFTEDNISNIQVFQNSEGSTLRLSHKDARSVFQQNDSTFWFASYGGGITRWRKGTNQLLNLRTTEGLPNNSVYGILGDENKDFIWMSTNNGVGRLNTKTLSFTNFSETDGLQNNEFNTGAFYKSKDGNLFFGGINGFNIINTNELTVNDTSPRVFLTEIKLFNEVLESDSSILFKRNLKLKHNENFLSFEFAALDYEEPSENLYAYKMDGLDPDWVYSGNRSFAGYPNLKPGEYTFRIKAANKYEIWNEEGTNLNIQVLPPWWQTWWFRTLYILTLLGFTTGLIRYYSQRKLKEQLRQLELKNKLRNERERISRDLHDHVGAQLANIITGLTLIDKYAEIDEKEKSVKLMKSLRGDAEVTIKQLRETIWALNQNELNLEGFTNHLNSFFKNQSALIEQLSLKVNVVGDGSTMLSAAQALNLFRIIQEASQNTLKYANAKNLDIHFKRENGTLEVSIIDDGTFEAGRSSFIGGNGMKNMKKRAHEIEGTIDLDTEKGTKIKIVIPV
ncbi:MAG: hypothetical protein BalsKO_27440 [Balneolaceae bacterium]